MSFLYVKAYHGPCSTFHSSIHKPHLLYGLRDRLQKLGFRIDLLPVPIDNYCMLEICGHEVFRCNLQHLKFNTAADRDVVCERAVRAVLQASVKFCRARAVLWTWTLMDHQLFRRSRYAPKDYWTPKVFRCNLTHFKFNTTADRAVCAVLQASVKFRRARAYLWIWTLMDHQLFRRSRYAPKDYWTPKINMEGFPVIKGCVKCCDIVATKRKKYENE